MSYQPPANGFRTFLIVWATQSVSVLGTALTFFAMTIWLTKTVYPRPEQKPALAFALSAISLAFALSNVFVAPLAGAWADRHDRKRTMIFMDLTNGCLSLLLAFLLVTHHLPLVTLLGLIVVCSALGAFHSSAFDTSYAMLVPAEQLPRANGMMQTMWSLSGVIAPAVAATIISLPALVWQSRWAALFAGTLGRLTDGTALVIGVDALTFFLAAFTLLFLVIPSPQRTDLEANGKPKKSLWADVKEGMRYIGHRRPLLWLLLTFTVANFTFSPLGVLQPLLVKFNLAADWHARGMTYEMALALLGTVGSIGGVVGGVAISAWGGLKKRRVYGVLAPMVLVGAAQICYGLSAWIWLSAAMALLMNFTGPIMNAHSQAIWQTQTPHELQGRVFSVRRLIAQCSWPLGAVLAGWAGGRFNPGIVVAALGVIALVFCLAQMFNPYLLRVEDKDWLDRMALDREALRDP